MGQPAFGGQPAAFAPQGGSLAPAGPSGFAPEGNGTRNLPVPLRPGAAPEPGRGGMGGSGPIGPGQRSRFTLSNWRVRWRLIAIIVIPTIAAIILGVVQIGSAADNYTTFQRIKNLATLNQAVVQLASATEDERDVTAGYIAAGRPSSGLSAVQKAQSATNQAEDLVTQRSQGVTAGGGYNSTVVEALDNGVLAGINDMSHIRDAALNTEYPALAVINRYSSLVTDMDTFSADIASGTSSTSLQTDVNELGALLRAENDASQQRGILFAALSAAPVAFPPGGLALLNQEIQQETADENQFKAVASVAESQSFDNTVSGEQVDEASAQEELATTKAGDSQALTIESNGSLPADCVSTGNTTEASCWAYTQGTLVQDMRDVSGVLVSDTSTQADSLASSALKSAVTISALLLVLLLIVLVVTTIVARSMIRPLRKLRSDALEVAGNKLPEMVRRLSQSEGSDESIEIEPIGVSSTDEIGEVARAFDQVHREAVRLAADEAMLRGNLNSMFVNLSRRSQSLIERQLSLIDNLEQGEQDPDRLSSLFRLDHLATRMRRNSENLLVLAGHEASRRWSQPVPLVDVLRAAISEIEQYERVVLNVQPGIVVVGQAVNDVVHLVAEIVENATTFSPEDTQVYVTGQPLTSGGVLLDITDQGVGISEQEMAHANWRLDNPPVVDVAVSRRMGLFVVGRLANRHGIRVRLRHAQSGGLTALIWLPDSVASAEAGAAPIGRLRRFEPDDYGPAASLSAPPAAATAPGFGQSPSSPAAYPPAAAAGSGPSGTATGNAAAASRIPRFTGGGGNGGNGGISGAAPFGGIPSSAGQSGGAPGNGGPGNGGPKNGGPSTGPQQLPVRPVPGGVDSFAGSGRGTGERPGFGADDPASAPSAGRLPSFGGDGGSANGGTGTLSGGAGSMQGVNGGPASVTAPPNGGSDGVMVPPPAGSPAQDQRLPIFDSLESDWFRRSGKPLSSGPAEKSAAETWSSPADEGMRAARVAAAPMTGETTTAGLPKRVPRANLVPGSVGAGSAAGAEGSGETVAPARSADDIRSRMSSFQRGVRDARAAAPQNEEP
jgi:signal transduction histidine kinase